MIKLDFKKSFIEKSEVLKFQEKVNDIHDGIINKKLVGNEWLGWLNQPADLVDQIQAIEQRAKELSDKIDVLVVIGIGGSYLGLKAAEEMIQGFYPQDRKVEIVYVGNTLSSTYLDQTLKYLQDKKFGICVISKSGGTLEPAISFRLFKNLLEQKVGVKESQNLIVAVCGKGESKLYKFATKNNYSSFIIPDDIGGRFSVMTAVGLFGLAIVGINVQKIAAGYKAAYDDFSKWGSDLTKNNAYYYAILRYINYQQKNYQCELFTTYEAQFKSFIEWLKQLFGESEGKDDKGLLPISTIFTADLHSLGQFIQEGTKNIFYETIIKVKTPNNDVKVPGFKEDYDGLQYLENISLHEINNLTSQGVVSAHSDERKIPNIIIEFDKMDETMFGYAIYWFMRTCTMSAYLLEVNPFNQPGVEIYKKQVFQNLKNIKK
ncbi:glucose-6-phosphate isomerase [Spiroplasma endosymbiont of Amphibalanus improvisus]|uniref:glucose-6-phosphate isomerase n=1 Tax=Spiroplasma endosymbiont of Amphibalanus improvisus TaxID=3066327 RepID=UPI00313DB988